MSRKNLSERELEKLINTPISLDSFDMEQFENLRCGFQYMKVVREYWLDIISICEDLRQKYLASGDEAYLSELLRVLPNSYKLPVPELRSSYMEKFLELFSSMKCCMNCGRRSNCRAWREACNLRLGGTVDYGCVCSDKWVMDDPAREIAGEIFDAILEQAWK